MIRKLSNRGKAYLVASPTGPSIPRNSGVGAATSANEFARRRLPPREIDAGNGGFQISVDLGLQLRGLSKQTDRGVSGERVKEDAAFDVRN